MILMFKKYATYDSYVRLDLANSERIICQITSEKNWIYFLIIFFFSENRLLAGTIECLVEWSFKQSSIRLSGANADAAKRASGAGVGRRRQGPVPRLQQGVPALRRRVPPQGPGHAAHRSPAAQTRLLQEVQGGLGDPADPVTPAAAPVTWVPPSLRQKCFAF